MTSYVYATPRTEHFIPVMLSLATPDGTNPGCPITFESFSENDIVTILACGHSFGKTAFQTQLSSQRNKKCPCCSQDVKISFDRVFSSIYPTNGEKLMQKLGLSASLPKESVSASSQTNTSNKISPIAIACIAVVTGFILGSRFRSFR